MSHNLRIGCIGEMMLELTPLAGERSAGLSYAGDVANTAIYLKRLMGDDAEIAFVSALGRDRFSDDIMTFLRDEAIATTATTRSDTRNCGMYAITTEADGERHFDYWRAGSAATRMFGEADAPQFDRLEPFDVLYLSAITLAILEPPVRDALANWLTDWRTRTGGRVAFDSNYRPGLWEDRDAARTAVARMWEMTDIALPSIDDEMALNRESDTRVLERFRGYEHVAGAMKRGALGPLPLDGSRCRLHFEPAETVVDTTAAGDAFNAGYLAAHLRGGDAETSLASGHACASLVVGHRGAIIPRDAWLAL